MVTRYDDAIIVSGAGFSGRSHLSDQTFVADTPSVLLFDTDDLTKNVAYSVGEFSPAVRGTYAVACQPQITADAIGTFTMWLQVDRGSGFINVDNSAVLAELANNSALVLPLISMISLEVGDKFRVMGMSSSSQVFLDYTEAVGSVPAIPANIVTLTKVSDTTV